MPENLLLKFVEGVSLQKYFPLDVQRETGTRSAKKTCTAYAFACTNPRKVESHVVMPHRFRNRVRHAAGFPQQIYMLSQT